MPEQKKDKSLDDRLKEAEIKKILNYLIETPEKPKHQIGFKAGEEN